MVSNVRAPAAVTIPATVRGATLGFVVAGLLLAAPASAQTPEVQVDPDSPAGTEYAIPLEKARQEAAGDDGKGTPDKRSGKSDQLFGEGIQDQSEEPSPAPAPEPTETPEEVPAEPVPADAPEDKPDRAKKKRSKDKQDDSESAPAATSSEGDSDPPQRTAAAVDTGSDDGSTGLTMGGIAVGVLGLGLLLGVGFRRLFRSA
jgi:hypothetical protein